MAYYNVLINKNKHKQVTKTTDTERGRKMKKSKEYKISVVLFSATLILMSVALVTGLVGEIDSLVEKISFFLGISSLGLGTVFLKKAEQLENNNVEIH